MKKFFLQSIMVLALTFVATSCKDKAKEAETNDAMSTTEVDDSANKYVVDVDASKIEWKGSKPTGTHNGTIDIATGDIYMSNDTIEGGMVVVDMTTIVSEDLEGEGKQKLEAHLKGTTEGKEDEFFNVKKYPEATFEITGYSGNSLSGNLTLKGTTNNVTFPATVSKDGNSITIQSETFAIDRTKWGVNYGSKTVFDNLGDSFVSDDIELKIMVKANKA